MTSRRTLGELARRHRGTIRFLEWAGVAAWALGGAAYGQEWVNPGTGDWFDAANWSPAQVPAAGDQAVVSNGGTATLSGVPSTPGLGNLSVGIASYGTGVGEVSSDSVTVLAGGVDVGVSSSGTTASGVLKIGGSGALLGGGGGLGVGTAGAAAGAAVGAAGTVEAGGGVSGFSSYAVGRLFGPAAAGSAVTGQVVGSGPGLASAVLTSSLDAGVLIGTNSGAASATGTLDLGGPLALSNAFVQIGQIFDAAAGSVAAGTVSLGGDAGTAGNFFLVGNVWAQNTSQVGSQATGALTVGNGGDLTLGAGTVVAIGTTGGPDRNGALFNTAQGTVTLDGTLALAGAPGALAIGQTTGGVADGALRVGTLAMGPNQLASLNIGTSGADGNATGRLEVGAGTLRVSSLSIGATSGGTARGYLVLSGADLVADRVLAGTGAGATAELRLTDSVATVTDLFTLDSGKLELERTLLTVGGFLAIGAGAELEIDIEGAVRGSEYGAIDARQAVLGGILGIDFTDFAPTADSEVFDLLRSGGADGIWGDFASLSFIGVQDGYSAVAGIELDGVEVYRVRLTRNSVPEPPSVALFLVALTMLAMTQWRGNAARSWRTASAKPQPRKP